MELIIRLVILVMLVSMVKLPISWQIQLTVLMPLLLLSVLETLPLR